MVDPNDRQTEALGEQNTVVGELDLAETGVPEDFETLDAVYLQPRQLLSHRFRIVRLLGKGGMGAVYLARDLHLGRDVAIKTLLVKTGPEASTLSWLQTFHREVASTARLQHPHITQLFDARVESGRPYMVLEHLKGQSLRERMDESSLPTRLVIALSAQLASALEHAHEQGIVHRDLKPANLFIETGERLKVLDFGVAMLTLKQAQLSEAFRRNPEELEALLGQPSNVAGTPLYMAPEQFLGQAQDGRTDLWSMGVVMYEMLSGDTPFSHPLRAMAGDDLPPLQRADVPDAVEALIKRCLSLSPDERPQSASELLASLKSIALLRPEVDGEPKRRTTNLVERPDPFIGRTDSLETLGERLQQGASRLVTVMGPGGVGKTRLVQALGQRMHGRFFKEVFFCDLSDAQSPEEIAFTVARALDIPLTQRDTVSHIEEVLQGWDRGLVILDTFDHLVEHASSLLGRWRKAAPQVHFLVTSRRSLDIAGEERYPLEALSPAEAVELYVARAKESTPSFQLTQDNTGDVSALVQALDGLPLAIELAASRSRVLSPAQMLQKLSRRFDLLRNQRRDISPRAATLRGAIDASWELLQAWEQTALAQLSVFEGGFTLEAAEDVVQVEAWEDAPFVMDILESLLDHSLIQVTASQTDRRLGMLKSIQAYADEKLRLEGLSLEAQARHGAYFAAWGEPSYLERLRGHGGEVHWRALSVELSNLIAALDRALRAGLGDRAASIAVAAYEVFELRGPFERGARTLDTVLDVTLSTVSRIRVLICAGCLWKRAGEPERARERLEEAISLAKTGRHEPLEGRALAQLSALAHVRGDYASAQEGFEEALSIARRYGDGDHVCQCLGDLAVVFQAEGRLDEARGHYEEALHIARKRGDFHQTGRLSGNLATLSLREGRHDAARDGFEEALRSARRMSDRRREGIWLGALGSLAFHRGHLDQARQGYSQALAIARELGARKQEALYLGNVALTDRRAGNLEEAHHGFTRALNLTIEFGDRRGEAHWRYLLSGLVGEMGRMEEMIAQSNTALSVIRELRAYRKEALCLAQRATLLHEVGRRDEAQRDLEAALEVAQRASTPDIEGRLEGQLAVFKREAGGSDDDVREHFERGELLLRGLGPTPALAELLIRRALFDLERRALDAARSRYNDVIEWVEAGQLVQLGALEVKLLKDLKHRLLQMSPE